MKIDLGGWASIAEIFGAVAIVISLVFVGFQINDGNRETRAATSQAVLDAEMLFQSELVRNAETWTKVVIHGDVSDEVETLKAIGLFNMSMTLHDNRYQMMRSGYIEYQEDSPRGMARFDLFDVWRKSQGARGRSPEFLEFIDDIRSQVVTE